MCDASVNAVSAACPALTRSVYPFNGGSVLTYGQFTNQSTQCATPNTLNVSVDPAFILPANPCAAGCPNGACSFNPMLQSIPLANADCNQNGVDHPLDTRARTSVDLNYNGIPDEREFLCIADVASDALDTTRNPNHFIAAEDRASFIASSIARR